MRKITILFLFFMITGCSYRFVGQTNTLPGGIKKLYIANINNTTNEPNLQIYLKNDLVNTFNLDRRVSVVASKSKADGILKVKIVGYSVDPISYNASGFAYRYRCSITANIELLKDNSETAEKLKLQSYKDYNAKNEVDATEKARENISKDVLNDLSMKIRNALFVNF